jgi:hypothetical protein
MKSWRPVVPIVGMISMVMAQSPSAERSDLRGRGSQILEEIVSQEWTRDWKGATLENVRLVAEKSDLAHPIGLPPVWVADIKGPGGMAGRLMWDSTGEGRIVEFSLDAKLNVEGAKASAISGIPNLQQFPIKDAKGEAIASGCVPTSAASVVSYWADKKFPQWRGDDGRTPSDLAKRLRARLNMTPFPDTDGFTPDGMTLAGANPHELAAAIRADAREKAVEIECQIARFSFEHLQEEIKSGRPLLLSCTVRVPHKPHLSWRHEVAGVGWAVIDDVAMVGVLDNFFPTKHVEAIRWIRKDAFSSAISLRPENLHPRLPSR